MHSTIGIDIAAPPELVYRLARDVTRWERLLPHYSRSAVVRREPDGTLVCDFVARRPFVPVLGLGLPVTWRSRTWHEPATRRLRFVHVAGATKGMDVTWTIEPTERADGSPGTRVEIAHDFQPRHPGHGRVRGPLVHPAHRGSHAGHVPRPGGIDRGRSRGAGMTRADGRRAVITGIGVVSAVGIGLPAFREGLRAARSPVTRISRFDPSAFRSQVAAQVDDFDPLDHMDARSARAMDRFSQFGLAAGRMAMTDAGLVPGAPGAPSQERIGIYLGSALGGIAFAEIQHEKYLAARPQVRLPHPRARGVRRRRAGQPRHRARRARADPVDGQLVRERRGGAGRGAQRDPRRRDRCRDRRRRRGAAVPARLRRVRHHPGAGPRLQRRPRACLAADGQRARRVRHGRGRGAARARGGGRRRGPRRADLRRGDGLRRDLGCPPHGPAATRRPGGRARDHAGARGRAAWRRTRSTG